MGLQRFRTGNGSFRALLLATGPGTALQVLRCLADVPVETHVLASPGARRLALSRYCKSFRRSGSLAPGASLEDLAADIEAMHASKGIDVVLPSDWESTERLAQIAPRLSVPTFPLSPPPILHSLSDKWEFYEFCRRHSLPVPKTISFGAKVNVDVARIGDELGFPAIIKPIDQGDGRGIVMVRSRGEVESLVSQNAKYPYEKLIAQEFIPGQDIDCSLLAKDGATVCSAVQIRDRGVVRFCENDDLAAVCSAALSFCRYDGVAHFDGRRDARSGRILLIECNPRFWRSISAASACGLNFVAEGLHSIGLLPDSGSAGLTRGTYLSPDRYLAAAFGFKRRGDIDQSAKRRALREFLSDPLPIMADFVSDELSPGWRRFKRAYWAPREIPQPIAM